MEQGWPGATAETTMASPSVSDNTDEHRASVSIPPPDLEPLNDSMDPERSALADAPIIPEKDADSSAEMTSHHEQEQTDHTAVENPTSAAVVTDDTTSVRRESFSRSRASVGLSLDGAAVANAIEHPDTSWSTSKDAQELSPSELQTDGNEPGHPTPLARGISNLPAASDDIQTPEEYERSGAFDAFGSAESYEPDWMGPASTDPVQNNLSDMTDSLMVDPSNPAMANMDESKVLDTTPNIPPEPKAIDLLSVTEDTKAEGEPVVEEADDSWDKLLGDTGHTGEAAAPLASISKEPLLPNSFETSAFQAELQAPADSTKAPESSWADAFNDEDETDDAWSKALSPDKPTDGPTWDNVFGDEDEDFLDEAPLETSPSQSTNIYAPPKEQYQPSTAVYGSPPPVQGTRPTPSNQNSGGMKFFEELPMTQTVRRSRPKPPAPSTPAQPPPPPSNQGSMPPRQPSVSHVSQYGQFHPPEKLDLFPQQPAASTIPTPPSGNYAPLPQQRPPPNTRYSPSQSQPGIASKYAAAPPPQSSRYNALPPQTPPSNVQQAPLPSVVDPASIPSATTNSFLPPQQPPPSRGSATSPPSASMRYSPSKSSQVPSAHTKPPAVPTSDYDMHPLPPPPVNRFAPRTSSPLAHQEHVAVTNDIRQPPLIDQIPNMQPSQSTINEASLPRASPPPQGKVAQRYSPGPSPIPSGDSSQAQGRSMAYTPQPQQPAHGQLPRPRTQSPETSRAKSTPSMPTMDRPASVQERKQPVRYNRAPLHKKTESAALDFVLPDDDQASDPLQRWKGSPIFRWNGGSAICTAFPKRVPRYGGGQAAPMLKCMPGEVKVQGSKEVAPIEDILVSFPGPLKSKNKKKDVLNWLSTRIQTLEVQTRGTQSNPTEDLSTQVRLEEKLLLWQILRIIVEHDGNLTGNITLEAAVRDLLVQANPGQIGGVESTELPPTEIQSEALKSGVTDSIKQDLLRGDREKAVWHAADNRMWGHAMLISSTLDQKLHKQVVQEFVRKEVRNKGQGNHSLAALYEVLAGNWEESIDELVPASARAGFQMMSTAETHNPSQDALQGLTKWRETLGLILGNRRSEDEQGILSLGNLLAGYGRVEAAHICFLFARSVTRLGGADDTQANFTLLGANIRDSTFEAGHDLESILLSEVYEFTQSLLPSSSAYYIPHLQAYKLHHAYILAECGRTSDALQYCEAIAIATKSTTKGSPYYHSTLTTQVDELYKRLTQSAKDSGSGWISKPSIEKVSGSMWAKFNSFVAGDEPDANSVPGAPNQPEAEIGPFAGLQNGTPTISRSNSSADIYGNISIPKRNSSYGANSRYAPNSGTSGLHEGDQGTYSPYGPLGHGATNLGTPPSSSQSFQPSSFLGTQSPYGASDQFEVGSQRSHGSSSYEPYIPSVPEEVPSQIASSFGHPEPSAQVFSYGDDQQSQGYQPNGVAITDEPSNNYGSYEPPTGGYEPPSSSYQPYEPETVPLSPEAPTQGPTPRKGIMEDDSDEDLAAQAAALKISEKARKDREADDAVRRAAEADAARDAKEKEERRQSGWFGGWWGGKKDKDMPTVHKAKLGEESSFYYDPVAKKWVNKKDPNGSTASAAPTPPPPRGPPGRNTSGAGTPPMGSGPPPLAKPPMSAATPPMGAPRSESSVIGSAPPSRTGTPASNAGSDAQPPKPPTSMPSEGLLSAAPPSRPSTSLSNASSIDDLMGVPAARKGGTVKKGKRASSRYVDVMNQGGA